MTQPLARLVTHVLSPPVVVVLLGLTVSWRHADGATEALRWAGLLALFASVGPAAIVLVAWWLGRASDLYVARREQRPPLFALGAGSTLIGAAVLGALGAPAAVVALAWALAAGGAVATALTLVWKVSFHAAVAAGALAVLALELGAPALLGLPLLLLVGWARVARGAHTPAQVAVGALLGAATAAAVFTLAR